jgi:hypothetical protein
VSCQASHTTLAWPVQTQLPWWALALPVLAFFALLALAAAGASAAPSTEVPARLLDYIARTPLDLPSHFP